MTVETCLLLLSLMNAIMPDPTHCDGINAKQGSIQFSVSVNAVQIESIEDDTHNIAIGLGARALQGRNIIVRRQDKPLAEPAETDIE